MMNEDKSTKRRLMKVTEKQKKVLMEYIKYHTDLIGGRFSQKITKLDSVKLWSEISLILNSMTGANKPWQGWRKCWQDIRSTTKCKIGTIKQNTNKTGGGPVDHVDLSTTEEDICSIIKQVSVEGHPSVKESIVQFNFDENSDSNALNKTEEWGEEHDYFTTPLELDNEEIIIEIVEKANTSNEYILSETPNKKNFSKKMSNIINAI